MSSENKVAAQIAQYSRAESQLQKAAKGYARDSGNEDTLIALHNATVVFALVVDGIPGMVENINKAFAKLPK